MKLHYLEMVASDVDASCDLYAQIHGVEFGEPDQLLGGARLAALADGAHIGIRSPMRDTEQPVIRPYLLVDDIAGSVDAAEKCGAEIAMQPTAIEGRGQFAIIIHGGLETGFWQL